MLPLLLGPEDRNIAYIQQRLGVELSCRGTRISISGSEANTALAKALLLTLCRLLSSGEMIDDSKIEAMIRLSDQTPIPNQLFSDLQTIRTRKGLVSPRSIAQTSYLDLLSRYEMVFALGPAGTGKTYLAVGQAVAMLTMGKVSKIVLSRPAVEAGERLGFLPGDMKEKVDPYLRPLYDALNDMLPADQFNRRMTANEIEIAPLAFMRGRTLSHAFVILDEAQNTTPVQMKMFLTRMGEGTRMVITGDMTQVDLPAGTRSGLVDAVKTLEGVKGIGFARFQNSDVVRHPLVARIVEAYDNSSKSS